MKSIQLKNTSGEEVLVNVDQIRSVIKSKYGINVQYEEGRYHCIPDEEYQKLKDFMIQVTNLELLALSSLAERNKFNLK